MRTTLKCIAAAVALAPGGVGAQPDRGEPAVERVLLAQALPANASGEALYLLRYVIPPGASLPPHIHEGTQIAWVESGVLTYQVAAGEVPIGRVGETGPGSPEAIVRAGERVVLGAGAWLVETPDDVHFGANEGEVPVVLFSSALLRAGAPLATLIGD